MQHAAGVVMLAEADRKTQAEPMAWTPEIKISAVRKGKKELTTVNLLSDSLCLKVFPTDVFQDGVLLAPPTERPKKVPIEAWEPVAQLGVPIPTSLWRPTGGSGTLDQDPNNFMLIKNSPEHGQPGFKMGGEGGKALVTLNSLYTPDELEDAQTLHIFAALAAGKGAQAMYWDNKGIPRFVFGEEYRETEDVPEDLLTMARGVCSHINHPCPL
jgi:hypothetical protein